MDNANAIEVVSLTKRYGDLTAVSQISFSVRRGEIVGFLGPNGAGKSTTMRILAGYLPATSGSAWVAGHPVASRPEEVKRRLGYMPENNPLPEDLRVREYLRFRAQLKGVPAGQVRARVDEVVQQCDLKRVATRLIGNLSKGFRQRVGIADALLAQPDVVIMDEPTIGLDPHQIVMIRDLLCRLRGRLTMVISSHILPEIERTCDRVIIINGGHIVAQGTPEELRREMSPHPVFVVQVRGEVSGLERVVAAALPGARVEAASAAKSDGTAEYRIHLSAPDDSAAERLMRALLAEPSLGLCGLAPHRPTLEEVFMAATRRSWDVLTPAARRAAGRPAT